MPRNIYIGYDAREAIAYKVCIASLVAHSKDFMVQPINYRFLGNLYTRPHQQRGNQLWDVISDAPMATEFSIARFFTPYMAGPGNGWVLFCDCDFMFRADVHRLFEYVEHSANGEAVFVVQHRELLDTYSHKMDGQLQTRYRRKNWSSLMMFNTDHPKVQALTPAVLNRSTGKHLHQFLWLDDRDIGWLPQTWNHLVGMVQYMTPNPMPGGYPKAAHFTLGIPTMSGYETLGGHLADEWRAYAGR